MIPNVGGNALLGTGWLLKAAVIVQWNYGSFHNQNLTKQFILTYE